LRYRRKDGKRSRIGGARLVKDGRQLDLDNPRILSDGWTQQVRHAWNPFGNGRILLSFEERLATMKILPAVIAFFLIPAVAWAGSLSDGLEALKARNAEKAAVFFQSACDEGIAAGCANLGELHYHGLGVKQDYGKALALFQGACRKGDLLGCKGEGNVYFHGEGVLKNVHKAEGLYKKTCEAGYAVGCNNLGMLYEGGAGVARDFKRAMALYTQSCDGGAPLGCANAGRMYLQGRGVEKNRQRALSLFEKSCHAGDSRGCVYWAEDLQKEENKDYVQIRSLYEKSCGSLTYYGKGCYQLGTIHYHGYGVPIDRAKAVELFQKSCNDNWIAGCNDLGVAYESGNGIKQDFERAFEFYKRACAGGASLPCNNLGRMYQGGKGTARDVAKAAQWFQFSCSRGYSGGCKNIATAYKDGQGVEKDPEMAFQHYIQACNLNRLNCAELGRIHEYGELLVKKDDKTAARFYEMACSKGHEKSCVDAQRIARPMNAAKAEAPSKADEK
jgi:TPR repeat protein